MGWITAEFSKKAVKRAGECLLNEDASDEEISPAMDVLSNWRSAHAYPMHAVLIFLRNQSAKIDVKSIVVQRLKRTPSIVGKLKRIDGMKLHRMQDISGCRSVVSNISNGKRGQVHFSRAISILKSSSYLAMKNTPKVGWVSNFWGAVQERVS